MNYIIGKESTNNNFVLKYVEPLPIQDILEELGDFFQNLRHLEKWSMTVEKGGWRARGFSRKPPHHHITINGDSPQIALWNLLQEVNK